MSIKCPCWENVQEAVNTIKSSCPFGYNIYRITGLKYRYGYRRCAWMVYYVPENPTDVKWTFEKFDQDMQQATPTNCFTVKKTINTYEQTFLCEHVFNVRCSSYRKCATMKPDLEVDFVEEGPRLVDGVWVHLWWSGYGHHLESVEDDEGFEDGEDD